MSLFAPDGCVQPNVATRPYRLTFKPSCPEHNKIMAVVVVIKARDEAAAREYVQWLKLPQCALTDVAPVGS